MTIWTATVGDLLDVSAEALICSANPQLNLSGGVGGALLLRYGDAMQEFLHGWLRQSGQRCVTPGTVVAAPPCGLPYRVVVHAVAIDAFYETSAELISKTYDNAFAVVSQMGCRTIASACLACGYGRATPELFAAAMCRHIGVPLAGIDRVELRSTNAEVIAAIQCGLDKVSE